MHVICKSIEIPLSHIKAALLFALKDDVTRRRLSGACIEFGTFGARMVATDGHRAIVISLNTDASEPVRYVVAREVLETACKAFAKQTTVPFVWERESKPDPDHADVTVTGAARITVGGLPTVDHQDAFGGFPEWERVVPTEFSGKLAQFNPYYLADCARARELLCNLRKGAGLTFIAHNGDRAGLATLAECAFAIVMPMVGKADTNLPAWFAGVEPDQKAAA